MRNKRLIIALTGAVLCGLLGVTLVTRYLASVQQYTKDLNNVVVGTGPDSKWFGARGSIPQA